MSGDGGGGGDEMCPVLINPYTGNVDTLVAVYRNVHYVDSTYLLYSAQHLDSLQECYQSALLRPDFGPRVNWIPSDVGNNCFIYQGINTNRFSTTDQEALGGAVFLELYSDCPPSEWYGASVEMALC